MSHLIFKHIEPNLMEEFIGQLRKSEQHQDKISMHTFLRISDGSAISAA